MSLDLFDEKREFLQNRISEIRTIGTGSAMGESTSVT